MPRWPSAKTQYPYHDDLLMAHHGVTVSLELGEQKAGATGLRSHT